MQPDFVARELLVTAQHLFRERSYGEVDLSDVAEAAGCSLDELYLRFPRKETLVLGLFNRTTLFLQEKITDAPAGTVAERFHYLVRNLLTWLEPDRSLYRQLLPALLDPESRLGVLGPATDPIRVEVRGVYSLLVMGATDAPTVDQVVPLVELLYFAHLGLIFLFLQDQREHEDFLENNLILGCHSACRSLR